MFPIGDLAIMCEIINYEQWTELLGSFFFDPSHDGSEILFAVDDLALSEMTGLSEPDSAKSLAGAVRDVISPAWDVREVKFRVRRWRTGGMVGDHPSLPLLALAVVAASRMHADGQFAATNFYVPLRRALNPNDAGEGTPGTYLEYVRDLWSDLAKWANEDLQGLRGRLVLRDPGPQYGRGAAIQHALVRSSDLSQLDTFFRRIGLLPGEGAGGKVLLRALRIWTEQRTESWAKRLHRLCSDDDLSEYAAALLEREAARWDGRPRDRRTGRGVGQIRLGISKLRNPVLGLYLRADSRLPTELRITPPGSEPLTVIQAGDWFQPHPLEHQDLGNVLLYGLRVPAGLWRFEFRVEDAYPLTYDDELGMWVSVDTISFGDRYHLLVRQNVAAEVRAWMNQVSATPLREDAAANRGLPAGWVLLQDLQLERRPSSSPPACLAGAIPTGSGPRLRLVGGLPLTAGPGVYLRGGEPGLALSSLVPDSTITITQEESGISETFNISGNRDEEIPLWKFQLLPGSYRVQHGETSVVFRIVDGIAEESGPGAGSVQLTVGARKGVVGTAPVPPMETEPPLTVRAPHASLTVLILGSHSSNFVKLETPTWIAVVAGPLSWSHLDFWGDFVPVWEITKHTTGRFIATALRNVEPAADSDMSSNWARVLKVASLAEDADEASRELWSRYQAAVGVTE